MNMVPSSSKLLTKGHWRVCRTKARTLAQPFEPSSNPTWGSHRENVIVQPSFLTFCIGLVGAVYHAEGTMSSIRIMLVQLSLKARRRGSRGEESGTGASRFPRA